MSERHTSGESLAALPLQPLTFVDGCNTALDVQHEQIKINIERDIPWLEKGEPKDRPLSIIASGASLGKYWPMIDLSTDIMALNNAYPFLMERGLEPNYFMMLDARPQNIDFLRSPSKKTKHLLASQCHPSIFDALKEHDVTLYLTTVSDILDLTKHIDKPKIQIAGTAGTVGIKALCMAYALGYTEVYLYGYDSSYHDGEHHALAQPLNDNANTIEVFLDGKKYVTTAAMAHQATEFCGLAKGMTQYYEFDINLRCDGLLPDMVQHCNKLGDIPLEIREREKYEQIWTHDVYRKEAPGEHMVEDAIRLLELTGEESIIDFGCGTGRASAKWRKLGYDVISVDFAANCVDDGLKLDFLQACLWELPNDLYAEIGYCTDVMEHIPMEKVQDVLSGISKRTQKAFFNVATRDDCLGAKIGRKLHMTVMPAEHWVALMSLYWESVKMCEGDGEATFVLSHPKESSAS